MTIATVGSERVQAYLREHGVCFTLQHHAPAYTAQQLAATEHAPGHQIAKTIIAIADGRVVMLVLPASCAVQTGKLAKEIGARVAEIADEDYFAAAFPDCEVGAFPPFGNLYGVRVFVDRRLADSTHIEFRVGTHSESMGMAYDEFARLVQPTIVDIAQQR